MKRYQTAEEREYAILQLIAERGSMDLGDYSAEEIGFIETYWGSNPRGHKAEDLIIDYLTM